MKHQARIAAITVIILSVLTFLCYPAPGRDRTHDDEGMKYYHTLEKLYIKWHDGLFGSRRYHERILRDFLNDLQGKDFRSDYNYIIDNDASEKIVVKCRFSGYRWLKIHGPVDRESVKVVTRGKRKSIASWWRGTDLLAVSGRVVRYRLGRDRFGDTVSLYLEKIYLHLDRPE